MRESTLSPLELFLNSCVAEAHLTRPGQATRLDGHDGRRSMVRRFGEVPVGSKPRHLVGMLVLVALTLSACSTDSADVAELEERVEELEGQLASTTTSPTTTSTSTTAVDTDRELTTVERIIDGDTLVISGEVRIRLIGVDTPEVDDDECYADQATAFLTSLIQVGTEVELVYDVERFDRFGRTLAYVYRADDGLFVNAELMSEGYAQVLTIPPNVAHADEFVALQQEARAKELGLWSACQTTTTQAPATTGPSPTTTQGGNCDPAYPTVCIPPPPPDLDCGEITHRNFTVLPPDPHGFDGNNDGVGCES